LSQSNSQSATNRRASLTLVPPPSRHQPQRNPLSLWHLLSLDAPTVASLWTVFVARVAHVRLPWTAPAAMFLAVWMLYAADRLLDARVLATASDSIASQDLEERHLFHHCHKRRFATVMIVASIVLGILLRNLAPAALLLYAILASLLFAYFFLIHIFPASLARNNVRPRLPKELAVGIFFPAAVFIPTVARAPGLRLALLPGALLFAAVCTLNCLYLYAWEHPGPRHSAHWTTRFATRHLRLLSIATVLLAAITVVLTQAHTLTPSFAFLAAASGMSAALLLLLHTQRHHMARIHLRAAADLALLTPLFLLPFLR
jgi:hypothetical protein